MTVVFVGEVIVRVRQRLVSVQVRVTRCVGASRVRVPVMFVVLVFMHVLDGFVGVPVRMPLR